MDTKIMTRYLLATVLCLVCFNNMVSGIREKHPNFECALRRCDIQTIDCERQSSSSCCSACPHERGCKHKGKYYKSGTSFKDSCNSCFCSNGLVRCTLQECLETSCFYKGKHYSDGESFKDECNTCRCSLGKALCTKIGCGNIGCLHQGKYYTDGQRFKDDCDNWCTCRRGSVGCTKKGCISRTCTYNGITYKDGQKMPSKNDCLDCSCRKGKRQCSRMHCLMVHCEGQRKIPGQCCPSCPDQPIW